MRATSEVMLESQRGNNPVASRAGSVSTFYGYRAVRTNWRKQKTQPKCCSPSLLVEFPEGSRNHHIASNCALVISSLSEGPWTGVFRLSKDDKKNLLKRIEKVQNRRQRDNALSLDEIRQFIEQEDNKEWVMSNLPSSAQAILDMEMVEEAMDEFDDDQSSSLDLREWYRFMNRLERQRLLFLHIRALQDFNTFWGRGRPWLEPPGDERPADILQHLRDYLKSQVDEEEEFRRQNRRYMCCGDTIQVGLDDLRGWWSDLYYYSANSHAVHGIIGCDPVGRLDKWQRLTMEVATVSFLLFTTHYKMELMSRREKKLFDLDSVPQRLLFNLLVVTIPGEIIWNVLFYLFTTPHCGFVDKSRRTKQVIRRARCCDIFGSVVGYILVIIGFVTLFWYYWECDESLLEHYRVARSVVVGRTGGYIIQWIHMAGVNFNPLVAWGQPKLEAGCSLGSLGDLVGIGRWSIQRQLFRNKCRVALELNVQPISANYRG